MAEETWQAKQAREAREAHDAVVAALALPDHAAVRARLEELNATPRIGELTWLWGPELSQRDRVMFRPVILSMFAKFSVDRAGHSFDPWKGETGARLQRWLEQVDAADDIELTKRLYGWKLEHVVQAETEWRAELAKRFAAATTPAARHTALAKVDQRDYGLDGPTALQLWTTDRVAAKTFILGHIPWRPGIDKWQPLLDASRTLDPAFHFELYRKLVDEAQWSKDVRALPVGPDIVAELERRHPIVSYLTGAATVFLDLLETHGAAAIPYVARHADQVHTRYNWAGKKQEGKGLDDLLALAVARGWFALWGTLLRTSASTELFDAEVKKLVAAGARARLELLPGRGREFNAPGVSWAMSHVLTDETACALYARYPDLARGPFRVHVAPGWNNGFAKLADLAIDAGDDDLVDYLASRLAVASGNPNHVLAIARVVAHYERLPDAVFVTRAASALSRMPAMLIWNYKVLVANNELAKLLFERSTALYLADGAAVRDLLESPQIHVQILAFRILGQRDPRAIAIAAANLDLLGATLLRKLRRNTRILAFAALANAVQHDEPTAKLLLGRMRDALALPEKRYPTEQLVGLIGKTLHRWPSLRGAREQPVVYG